MKPWMAKALELLRASLEPPQHELNELDWKAALSPDKRRLTEHLSAFANLPGGGYPDAKKEDLRLDFTWPAPIFLPAYPPS